MRSSSRNSRKQYRALSGAAVASLLLGSAVLAAGESHNFVMTAYSDVKGGEALANGHYDAAVTQLSHASADSLSDPGAISNNRCVAFTVTKQWDAARAACDAAVRDAHYQQIWGRALTNDYLALALSNRAVLHWMASDTTAAEADLKKAQNLAPKADFIGRNLAAMHSSQSAVAEVTAASGN